jgi:tRNA G18 (ribose-2'-O)-methylase SpoU
VQQEHPEGPSHPADLRSPQPRHQLAGPAAISAALERGDPLRLIILDADAETEATRALLAPARAAAVPVQTVGSRHFARLCPNDAAGGAVALVGNGPLNDPAAIMATKGPAWLLTSIVYPGNAGSAIRTAEVSGAAGVFLDTDFDHPKRRDAVRASMRADRFFPVLWMKSDDVIDAARAAGRGVIAVEDVGDHAPWAVDLTGPKLFIVGGEADGIPATTLDRCDHVVRIPMAGFLRTYNLQAAVAIMAAERMRQLEQSKQPQHRKAPPK